MFLQGGDFFETELFKLLQNNLRVCTPFELEIKHKPDCLCFELQQNSDFRNHFSFLHSFLKLS